MMFSNGYRFLTAILALLCVVSGCARPLSNDPPAEGEDVWGPIRQAMVSGGEGGGSAGATTVSTGTGWATLTGRFTLASGVPMPSLETMTVTQDAAVCGAGASSRLAQTLLVDEQTRGIANVAIFVRKKPQRVHDSAKQMAGAAVFDQKDCVFLSHVFPVIVGTEVSIKNSDGIGHNTKVDGKRGAGVNKSVPAGQSLPFTPLTEEAMPVNVSCSIHPWMKAYMLPRENGYFAVTAPDGTFKIENLPDGEELELQVWHERATGGGGALAEAQADGVKWNSKGRLKITLKEGATPPPLNVVVPGSAFN
jgi:plastocyanin